jgi:hypothetical protein
MNKYKREFVEKVKQKFDDVQAGKNNTGRSAGRSRTDKGGEILHSERVDKKKRNS